MIRILKQLILILGTLVLIVGTSSAQDYEYLPDDRVTYYDANYNSATALTNAMFGRAFGNSFSLPAGDSIWTCTTGLIKAGKSGTGNQTAKLGVYMRRGTTYIRLATTTITITGPFAWYSSSLPLTLYDDSLYYLMVGEASDTTKVSLRTIQYPDVPEQPYGLVKTSSPVTELSATLTDSDFGMSFHVAAMCIYGYGTPYGEKKISRRKKILLGGN